MLRKQRARKLGEHCDRYRTERDVRPLLDEILRPLNEGKTQPERTLSVAKFVEGHYLPFVEENYKPSTLAGYKNLWEAYLSARLSKIVLRDFRTVDAANLLAEIHRTHSLGRTMLKHIKSFLSGVFTYVKNQGVIDGAHPIRDAMIPRKAAISKETHAATPDEVLAIMEALDKAGEKKNACCCSTNVLRGTAPRRGTRRLLGGLRRETAGCSPIGLAYAYAFTQDGWQRKACACN